MRPKKNRDNEGKEIQIDLSSLNDFEPPNESVIAYFVDRFERGLPVPMPCVAQVGDKFIVVDGRCRLEAARRMGETTFSAYVIDESDPAKLAELRQSLNARLRGTN